jgi:N-acetylglucosaminyldiphosphoundecaprenol N-acetyl-beta-D-mannosaminyltransferase
MNICGINIDKISYDETLDIIDNSIKNKNFISISNPNFYIINSSCKDQALRATINNMSIRLSDGIGVYLASKFLYGKSGLDSITKGTDLYNKILVYANENNLKMLFYGGDIKTPELLSNILNKHFPHIKINGIFSRFENKNLVIEQILKTKPDIVFIGLGTPIQENFISVNFDSLNVPVFISVGSGLDFISGYMKRAPKWMLKLQLEWLHRLLHEPARLWKRYIIGLPLFFCRVIRFKFSRKS